MGAVFSVALARVGTVAELPGVTVALVTGEGRALAELASHELRSAGTVSLLIGAEREGLPPEVRAAADVLAHIPIATHSLNAAMAATVALYEMTRMAPA
jgi:RNA methyltransferase, TrmH family